MLVCSVQLDHRLAISFQVQNQSRWKKHNNTICHRCKWRQKKMINFSKYLMYIMKVPKHKNFHWQRKKECKMKWEKNNLKKGLKGKSKWKWWWEKSNAGERINTRKKWRNSKKKWKNNFKPDKLDLKRKKEKKIKKNLLNLPNFPSNRLSAYRILMAVGKTRILLALAAMQKRWNRWWTQ